MNLLEQGHQAEKAHRFAAAESLFMAAISDVATRAEALRALAFLRLKSGEVAESISYGQQALALNPSDYLLASSQLYASQCLAETAPETIWQQHLQWAEQFTAGMQQFPARPRAPLTGRRLRVGFISPDFNVAHPVMRFFTPLVRARDRARFEWFGYHIGTTTDQGATWLRQELDHWHEFSPENLPAACVRIWEDELDLLIDLAGHSSNHGLHVLATKPCPVQATYLGYPNTTGLRQVDYRLVDAQSDPVGMTERWHTEQLVRLPESAWCFDPPVAEVTDWTPPRERNGYVTYGCFNALAKFSSETLAMWREILRGEPTAHLLIKASVFIEESGRQRFRQKLELAGLPTARLKLSGSLSHADHLQLYREVDIALDTYPYHGTTTTCEALWMGVPVITRAGTTHISRVGCSLLAQVGLSDLITEDAAGYVASALALARDQQKLKNLHSSLRSRMQKTALVDAGRFMRSFEAALETLLSEGRVHPSQIRGRW